ncbi:MAG: MGH1-like glycoside hydrolase domain-containing protein, partial [bacterium]
GENIAANALLYAVLVRAASLAQIEGDAALAASYATRAANLKTQINARLWDTSAGAYRDNPTSTMIPQDGNALAVWYDVVDSRAKARSISYVLGENWNDKGSRAPEFTFGTGVPRISTFAGSMELMSHFQAGYDTRGLDMIRSMWGYMLDAPHGTRSTIWEGLNSDGSFAYQGPFQSLSHGWGTGPTSALTYYVLGLTPDTVSGQIYHVIPHPGDLTHVEGKLTMAPGKVVFSSYDVGASCQTFSMRVDAQAHTGSTGRIGVPRFAANHTVLVNGAAAWNGTSFVGSPGIAGASQDADYIYFTGVQPGVRTFSYTDGVRCPAAPEQWSFCSDENGTCSFSGTKRVRYGKRGKYSYGIFTGSVPCTNGMFGDPIANVPKSCQFSSDLYTACASEGQTCTFPGTKEVRFGANGQWVTRIATGSIACTNATFGDPIPNVVKRCEAR